MKIAYNSAYVQIEMFNFAFAQQAFIGHFYRTKQAMTTKLPHVKFCCIRCCYRWPSPEMLHFCKFRTNANIDLKLDCIFRKPMKRIFQWYIVCMEILSTYHAWVEYSSVQQIRHWSPLKPMGIKTHETALSPCGMWIPSNTPILDRPHSSPQMASRSIQPFCHSTLSEQTDSQTDR